MVLTDNKRRCQVTAFNMEIGRASKAERQEGAFWKQQVIEQQVYRRVSGVDRRSRQLGSRFFFGPLQQPRATSYSLLGSDRLLSPAIRAY